MKTAVPPALHLLHLAQEKPEKRMPLFLTFGASSTSIQLAIASSIDSSSGSRVITPSVPVARTVESLSIAAVVRLQTPANAE